MVYLFLLFILFFFYFAKDCDTSGIIRRDTRKSRQKGLTLDRLIDSRCSAGFSAEIAASPRGLCTSKLESRGQRVSRKVGHEGRELSWWEESWMMIQCGFGRSRLMSRRIVREEERKVGGNFVNWIN